VSYGARVSTSYGGSVSTAYGGRVDRVNQLSAEQEAEKLGAALVDAYSTANGDPVGTGMRTSLQRYLMYEAILMRVAFQMLMIRTCCPQMVKEPSGVSGPHEQAVRADGSRW